MRDIIVSKQLELCDIPASQTQQLIADSVLDLWEEFKRTRRNPDWDLEPHVTADPNRVQFQMRVDDYTSIITIGRYTTREDFPEGCLSIKTTNQPLEFHSGHKGAQLDDVVMECIEREVAHVFEDIVADMKAEEAEDDYELE